MTAAGRLRHRVTLERDSVGAQAADGSVAQNWTALGTVWAAVEPLSGRELYAARQVQSEATHSVRLRANTITLGLTSRDRVKFGDRVFQIAAPPTNPEERGRDVLLACVERIAE